MLLNVFSEIGVRFKKKISLQPGTNKSLSFLFQSALLASHTLVKLPITCWFGPVSTYFVWQAS